MQSSQNKKLKILGFDPSITNWGVAAAIYHTATDALQVKYVNTISPLSTLTKNKRDVDLASQLFKALDPLIKQADVICIEVPVGSQNFRSAVNYAMCCALIGVISAYGVPVIQVSPNSVKNIVGERTATKREVVEWVQQAHPEVALPYNSRGHLNVDASNHYCDAIVAIHAALNKPDLQKIIEEYTWKSA